MRKLKDLPKVFAKPIEKDVKNNKDLFYSKLSSDERSSKNILKEIDEIFHDRNFVYKSDVEITTKDGTFIKTIVGKNGSSLLTLDGEAIRIIDILIIADTIIIALLLLTIFLLFSCIKKFTFICDKIGASSQNRTGDPSLTMAVLYLLSYRSIYKDI